MRPVIAMKRFRCESCGRWHEGAPSLGADHPLHYFAVPQEERATRCSLTSETCVIDGEVFYIRGCIEVPIRGSTDIISYGAWVSLSKASFDRFVQLLTADQRENAESFFGWLSDPVPTYPEFKHLKTRVHLRNAVRPYIELEPTEHPLAVEQRLGALPSRVQELYRWIESRSDG